MMFCAAVSVVRFLLLLWGLPLHIILCLRHCLGFGLCSVVCGFVVPFPIPVVAVRIVVFNFVVVVSVFVNKSMPPTTWLAGTCRA